MAKKVIIKKEPGEYSLTLTGFRNKKQVQAFIDWYEGSGEQDACNWFDIQMSEGQLDVDCMNVDVDTKYKWTGKNLTAKLDI